MNEKVRARLEELKKLNLEDFPDTSVGSLDYVIRAVLENKVDSLVSEALAYTRSTGDKTRTRAREADLIFYSLRDIFRDDYGLDDYSDPTDIALAEYLSEVFEKAGE